MPSKKKPSARPSGPSALETVRRLMRSSSFDEEEVYGGTEDQVHFASREEGDILEGRADPGMVRFARAKAREIEEAVPGAKARVEGVDEWVSITVTLPQESPVSADRGPMHTRKKKQPPYASESLAVSRRMIAPGPLHEEHAIIFDLMTRYRHLQSTLRYYDRTTGKPIADEAEKLRKEAWRRIEALPEGDLRSNLTREMYE
jgi:hypothetical protein